MRRALKYGGVAAGAFLAGLTICIIGLTATGPGQQSLLRIVAWLASSEDVTIKTGALEGSLFGKGTIASLSFSDREGQWARFDTVRFDWTPSGLLSGELDITRLEIASANVRRLPQDKEDGTDATQMTGDQLAPPSAVIPPIRIGVFSILDVALAEEVVGTAAKLAVAGHLSADDPANKISGSLNIEAKDHPSSVQATFDYDAAESTLNLVADVREQATDGVVAAVLDMQGHRDLRLVLNGSGPIAAWRADWNFSVDGARRAGGRVAIDETADGTRLTAEADGEIAHFVPPPYASLLAGESALRLQAYQLAEQRYRIDQVRIRARRMTADAAGEVDLAANRITGDAALQLGDTHTDEPISIKLPGDSEIIKLRSASAAISAKSSGDDVALTGNLEANQFDMAGNGVRTLALQFSASRPEDSTGPFTRLEAIDLRGQAEGVTLAEKEFQPLAGERITFAMTASKTGRTLFIQDLTAQNAAAKLTMSGQLTPDSFEGEIGADVRDAQMLSALAERDLAGRIKIDADGTIESSGQFRLSLDGETEKLNAGPDLLGRLLGGNGSVQGSIERNESGDFRFGALTYRSPAFRLTADGQTSAAAGDLTLSGEIPALEQILPNSSGSAHLDAEINGSGPSRTISLALTSDEATIRKVPIDQLHIGYEGRGGIERQEGTFKAKGQIGGSELTGEGRLDLGSDGNGSVQDFRLALGSNVVEGHASLSAPDRIEGQARLSLQDTSLLTQLLGRPLDGSLNVSADLSGRAVSPEISLRAKSEMFAYDGARLDGLTAEFHIADSLDKPVFDGRAELETASFGTIELGPIRITATPEDGRSKLAFEASLDPQRQLSGAINLALTDWQPDTTISDFAIQSPSAKITQKGTAQISADSGTYQLRDFVLTSGDGEISAQIDVGEMLDGRVEISRFPASSLAQFFPEVTPQGNLDGAIQLTGATQEPEASYQVEWSGAAIEGPLPSGLPPVTLSASGEFRDSRLQINANAAGPDGLSMRAKGSIRDIDSNPDIQIQADGTVPLSLADRLLVQRGTQLTGSGAVSLAISGTPDTPQFSGQLTARNAVITDPQTGISLSNMTLDAQLSEKTVRIVKLRGTSKDGGNVTVSGDIDISKPAALPVNLKANAEDLDFDDRRLVAGTASGDVTFAGEALGQSKLSGNIDLQRLDVSIPRSMPGSIEELDLKHKNAPPHIAAAQPPDEDETQNKLPSTISLSLNVKSANRIFVTGRGLDAQLGGDLQLTGTANNPRAIGEFTLVRGSMALLGRTLKLVSGSVSFSGDLDPQLEFTGETDVEGTQITVTLSGRASDPEIAFASTPELPEDEILALLLFNKSLGDLSALQMVQLASQVSELGGLTAGPGVVDRLKAAVGVDQLDLTTNEDGEVAVQAGSYLNDKVYVGVEQGSSEESSQVKIDLDITKNLKLRGEAGADGKSKLGIGLEWEY